MKKLLVLAFVFVIFACNNDDDSSTVPACVEVTNITANDITATSANLSWDDTNNAGSYSIEYGLSGFAAGNGITLTSESTFLALVGLMSETTYDVYVQVNCSEDNSSLFSEVYSFATETLPVIPEFRTNLSELNLYSGDLSELAVTNKAFKYRLNSQLFTDYSHKQRFIVLPDNTSMTYDGDGLPIFPDNTVIVKTFFFNNDERDLNLGRQIIETRLLIKINGTWETGDYKWNEAQTEATLDLAGSTLPVSWIDADGNTNMIDYEIPSNADCFTCHNNNDISTPIGPKLRSMNLDIGTLNQLDRFIADGQLTGVTSSDEIGVLPNWEDEDLSLEERARAYLDINCAHCHIPGGHCEDESTLDLAYETSFEDSNIEQRRFSIEYRISTNLDGISMPLIGTSIIHDEGVNLVLDYLNSLE